MTQDEILKILFEEASKELDKTTEFNHGRTSGKMEAYSHAYALVKYLNVSNVSNIISLGKTIVKNGEIGKVIKKSSRGFNWWIVDWNRGAHTEEYGSDLNCLDYKK